MASFELPHVKFICPNAYVAELARRGCCSRRFRQRLSLLLFAPHRLLSFAIAPVMLAPVWPLRLTRCIAVLAVCTRNPHAVLACPSR